MRFSWAFLGFACLAAPQMAAKVPGVSYLQDGEEGWSRHILPALSVLQHQESKSLPRSHLFPDLCSVSLDRAGSHGHVLWGWEIRDRVDDSWLRLVFVKHQQALESPGGLKTPLILTLWDCDSVSLGQDLRIVLFKVPKWYWYCWS